MYTEMVPNINKLLKDQDEQILIPKTFYADYENGLLIMENLKKLGYVMIDKAIGKKSSLTVYL